MRRTVYKFLMTDPEFDAPAGRVVLVAPQKPSASLPTVWIDLDLDQPTAERSRLFVFGTGHPVPDGLTHVGSAVCADGALVWHVFESTAQVSP